MRAFRIGRRISVILLIAHGVLICACCIALYSHRTAGRQSAESFIERADALSWNNRWEEARPLYREAEAIFAARGDAAKSLYASVSQIPPDESADIPNAIWNLTADLARPGASDPETRLRVLTVRGTLQTNQDAGQARATWEEVGNLAKALHHYGLATRAMGEQGIAAFLLGDTLTAKKQVLAAWELSKIERDPAASIRYASAFGAGLVAVGRYSEAMTPLDEAIKIANAHPEVAYPSVAINTKIDALAGLHRYSEAMGLANDALRRLQGTLYNGRKTQLYVSRGFINVSRGAVNDAIADYEAALELAQQMRNFRGITDAAGMLAQTYLDAGRLREALGAVNSAIEANTHIPDELYLVPRDLLLKAQILEKLGRANQAEEYYGKGITLVDAMIRRAPTVNIQRYLLTEMSDIYSGYFASLCLHRRYDEALQVLERVRGRLEVEAIKHHESQPVHTPTPEERRLAQLNIALVNSDDPKWRSNLMDEIYRAELDISPSRLIDDSVSHPVNVRQLQQTLSPAQLVIEYVLAEPNSYALAITKNGVQSYRLRDKTTLEAEATKYRDEIRARAADPALARLLYTELLSSIQEYASKRDLIIIPDGKLHLLPFSALIDQQSYVLTTHTIDVEPSATCFALLQARSKQRGTIQLPYLGVAAWTETSKSRNPILRMIGGPERSQFIPLPGSKGEVEAIADDLPSPNVILLGSEATETRFKALATEGTEVIHLALHGYADLEYPDRSALVFATEHAGPDDGLLQVREIRSLHLNAKLVTLSACDTGVGPVGEADIADIVNAFIEAGADSVVSTLWELEDQATEHLMVDFYSRLALHERKIDALREAQLELLNSGLPPYFWAGVQIVGDPSGTI